MFRIKHITFYSSPHKFRTMKTSRKETAPPLNMIKRTRKDETTPPLTVTKRTRKEEIAPQLNITTYDEIDVTSNPYPDDREPTVSTEKVHFDEIIDGVNVHRYMLQDENGGYSSLITSATSLLQTWKEWNRPEATDDIEEPKLSRANKRAKKGWGNGGDRFNGTVSIACDAFSAYLNWFTDNDIRQPLTFVERANMLNRVQGKCPKKFSQYFPSSLFVEIENWIIQGCQTFSPFVETKAEDIIDFARFVNNPAKPDYSHINHAKLRRSLLAVKESIDMFAPVTGVDIAVKQEIAGIAGKMLHSYFEYRLADLTNHTPELAKIHAPMREPEDYIQCERFIASIPPDEHFESEVRFGSFTHKICGSSDLVRTMADGSLIIEDYKRTDVFHDEPWFREGIVQPELCNMAPSSALVKFAIQLAIYRKLAILNGTADKPVRVQTLCRLHIFHPSLANYVTIEIDLSKKMKTDTNKFFCGIGGHVAQTLSPIELVELLFEFHKQELRFIYFGER